MLLDSLCVLETNDNISVFSSVPQKPSDHFSNMILQYAADSHPNKINAVIGTFRTDELKPYVLPVVKKANHLIFFDNENLNYEYTPVIGDWSFTQAAAKLVLGQDSPAICESRVTGVQTVSGTGSLHIGAKFLAEFYPRKQCYISNPTWNNYYDILTMAGLEVKEYPYWNAEQRTLDYEGMLDTMREAPQGSIFILQAVAHNPTGIDPTREQWQGIAQVMCERNHFPFFDCAYQGIATGDLHKDAFAVRYFVNRGFELFIAQSFSKNFGLYCERAGSLTIVTKKTPSFKEEDAEEGEKSIASKILSQIEKLQCAEILNPPAYGCRIVNTVLNDSALYREWQENLKYMTKRITDTRKALFDRFTELGTPGYWGHITTQVGMYSYTGITVKQANVLREKYHIYLPDTGRITIPTISSQNVDYFVKAMDNVIRNF